MPPKKGKAEAVKAKKAVEDKTFGLKNKNKSAKMQKYVQQVQQQATQNVKSTKKTAEEKKAIEQQKKAEMAELFKPIQVQKVPFGVDPKTVLCSFFKAGTCQKGTKCKFSHDTNVERKGAKRDVYTDKREDDAKEDDKMEDWDQQKLESVVNSKHLGHNVNKPTEIVCKFFLEAIENKKYGWFWECPNGGDKCKYRHALPPGYILKTKETEEERRRREEDEKENAISLEEFLETERHNLGSNLTKVTLETFNAWKTKVKKQAEEAAKESEKRKRDAFAKQKAGLRSGMTFSGRELFEFNPELAEDAGDDDGAMEAYERDEENKEGNLANDPQQSHGVEGASMEANDDDVKGKEPAVQVDEELFEDLEGLDIDDDEDDE